MQQSLKQKDDCDVRYSRLYAFLVIALALLFLLMAADDIIRLRVDLFQDLNYIIPALYILVGILFLYSGITLRSRKYLRIDMRNHTLMVFGTVGPWSRKYPFDAIRYENNKFLIEQGGKTRKIHMVTYTCDNEDLTSMIEEINNMNQSS